MDITPLNAFVYNDPVQLNALQTFLLPYSPALSLVWMIVWICVAILLCVKVMNAIRGEHKHSHNQS